MITGDEIACTYNLTTYQIVVRVFDEDAVWRGLAAIDRARRERKGTPR